MRLCLGVFRLGPGRVWDLVKEMTKYRINGIGKAIVRSRARRRLSGVEYAMMCKDVELWNVECKKLYLPACSVSHLASNLTRGSNCWHNSTVSRIWETLSPYTSSPSSRSLEYIDTSQHPLPYQLKS